MCQISHILNTTLTSLQWNNHVKCQKMACVHSGTQHEDSLLVGQSDFYNARVIDGDDTHTSWGTDRKPQTSTGSVN